MNKGEKLADVADYGEEQAAGGVTARRLDVQRASREAESRQKAPWRFGPIMSPRTNDLLAAVLEEIHQMIRDELRPVQTLLQSITDTGRPPPAATPSAEEMLTVEQVAETVKVAGTTVRKWIHSGQLRAIRPGVGRKGEGRTFRVSRADLEQFLGSVQERVTDSDADARKEAAKIVAIVASKRKT